jgi:hypothetical protein
MQDANNSGNKRVRAKERRYLDTLVTLLFGTPLRPHGLLGGLSAGPMDPADKPREDVWCAQEDVWCAQEDVWCAQEDVWCAREELWCAQYCVWCAREAVSLSISLYINIPLFKALVPSTFST